MRDICKKSMGFRFPLEPNKTKGVGNIFSEWKRGYPPSVEEEGRWQVLSIFGLAHSLAENVQVVLLGAPFMDSAIRRGGM